MVLPTNVTAGQPGHAALHNDVNQRVNEVDDELGTFTTTGKPQALPQLVDVIKRAKFGKIGTDGKGVISFRFDHQLDPLISTIKPLMTARALPFSVGVVTQSVGNPSAPYEPTTSTWQNVKDDILNIGGEVWSHSRTHGDDGGDYESEIVGSKADIEAQGIVCQGWQQPGGPATYGPAMTSAEGMNALPGRLIRDTYGLYEASIAGTNRRNLPTDGCWGHNHITIDTRSLAQCQRDVDEAVQYGVGVQLMLHPQQLGEAGFLSVADFTALLDYVVTLRDAGSLEVLTASGLAFADPGTAHRPSLLPFGDFETMETAVLPWPWKDSGAAWTIQTDGGHTGSRYLRVPSTASVAICRTTVGEFGLAGHQFMFEGWVRSTDVGGATWRVGLSVENPVSTHTTTRLVTAAIAQDTVWTKVRVPIYIPVGALTAAVSIGRLSGGSVDWDDVRVVAV